MTITRTFSTELNSTYVPSAIVEVVHFRDMTFDVNERVACYIDNSNAIIDIGSFNIGKFPDLSGDETEVEEALALNKAENDSNKIGLKILQRKNNTGAWLVIAEFILMNFGRIDYIDLRGRLGYPTKLMEKNDALAIQLIDYGDGLLWDTDYIKVDFAATIEIVKKNDTAALEARIASLELALQDRLINLPAGTLLGRNGTTGTVQQIPQSQFATPAQITTAINSLVNSSPGALDTLNELALALGSDANFAATMTNQLATKAPLDSNEKLALPLNKMPIGNAWGQEIIHGIQQSYAWNTTPFGVFFAFSFTGSQLIPNAQYYGCKWALGSNVGLLGWYVQLLISRQNFSVYLQWVENSVIVREVRLNTTQLF